MRSGRKNPLQTSSVFHEGEVVEANHEAEPNRFDRPLPRNHVWVRMPWKASEENPDPISAHPIPVYVNLHHTPGRHGWEQLPPGTRVLVAEVDKIPGINTLGLAVVAFGPPNTDQIYADTRQTSHYQTYPDGSVDKIVDADEDAVTGPNEDVGHTHLDARGYGWQSRHPWPDDPNRDTADETAPGNTLHYEKRLDGSKAIAQLLSLISGGFLRIEATDSPQLWEVELSDGATVQVMLHTKPGPAWLEIKAGPIYVKLEPSPVKATIDAPGGTVEVGPSAATVNLAGGGAAVGRVGDQVQVVIPSGSSAGTYTGTIISGSSKVFSG